MGKSTFTMIARHGNGSEVTGYTVIDSNYRTAQLSAKKVTEMLGKQDVEITNLELEGGKIVASNGAIDNYTLITPNGEVKGARAVVLNRVESNGKLVGYTVFMPNGTISELNVAQAVDLCNKKLLSNGKIRHTESGDIVSSIKGEYILREIALDAAAKEKINLSIIYFASIKSKISYTGLIVDSTSAAVLGKVVGELDKANENVIDVCKKAGNTKTDSLKNRRTGATSRYVVIDTNTFKKLLQSGATIAADRVMVSAIEYKDESFIESVLEIGGGKITVKSGSGSSELDEYAKAFAGKVAETLK